MIIVSHRVTYWKMRYVIINEWEEEEKFYATKKPYKSIDRIVFE